MRTAHGIELVPERLYALGGTVALDGRVSWVAASARGYQPANCYLLREGRQALLVDTGLAIHGDPIANEVRRLLPSNAELAVFLTRSEPDTVGSLGKIAEHCAVNVTYCGSTVNPWDAVDGLQDGVPPPVLRPPRAIDLGPDRIVDVIAPAFRMLPTSWLFDRATGTLFTSDLFGHTTLTSAVYQPVRTAEGDSETTLESVTGHTRAKFWWLQQMVTRPIMADLEWIFSTYEVARIAPSHGCILEGVDLIRKHHQLLQELLASAALRDGTGRGRER